MNPKTPEELREKRERLIALANNCFSCFSAETSSEGNELVLVSEMGEDVTEQLLQFVDALALHQKNSSC